MKTQVLDYLFVPGGILVMVAYHIWLLYHVVKHPVRTIIGINAINRRFWVRFMMEDVEKNGVLAVQTLRNNIMASTLMASTAIMLCSLIAVLMTSGSSDSSVNVVYGHRSEFGCSIKFFSILVCFLVSFLLNVQSIRYFSHAGILINVPYQTLFHNEPHRQNSRNLMAEYVASVVNRGSYFWSLGLRAFYFSFPLFLWIFGPIPMFLSSLVLVFLLYFLDASFDFEWVGNAAGLENYSIGDESNFDST
ncbi:hypothetical protein NMG60_11020040 [Bertholletia excelsa]